MKLKTLALGLMMAVGLAGCQSFPTETQKIATSCSVASTALKTLTVANQEGKLSVEDKVKISAAAHEIEPICGAEDPPTMDSVKRLAFERAIDVLIIKAAAL